MARGSSTERALEPKRARSRPGCYTRNHGLTMGKMGAARKTKKFRGVAGGAYRDEESSKPPSLSRPKREVRGENGVEMVLSSGTDGDGCGVRQRCSGIGRDGRCGHGATGAEQQATNAWQPSSARSSPRLKMTHWRGGTRASAAQDGAGLVFRWSSQVKYERCGSVSQGPHNLEWTVGISHPIGLVRSAHSVSTLRSRSKGLHARALRRFSRVSSRRVRARVRFESDEQ